MVTARTDYQKLVQAKNVPELPLLRAISVAPGIGAMIWDLEALPEMKPFPFSRSCARSFSR